MGTTIVLLLLLGGVFAGPVMSDVEKPKYEVVESYGSIEVREYEPMIVAEVQMTSKREQAVGDGFRLLADYIFGNNTVQKSIAMTAPVQQQSQEIAMTAPVQQQEVAGSWAVSFVMPSEFTMSTLPQPNNDQVVLKEVPAKRFAAIRFSGRSTTDNIAEYETKLMAFLQIKNLNPIGAPLYAFYNPPWTLPFLRRNEVMLQVESP